MRKRKKYFYLKTYKPEIIDAEKNVRFCDVETHDFVEVEDIENFPDVSGKFVKIIQRVKSSGEIALNKSEIISECYKKGAKAVVWAPVVVKDSKKIENFDTGKMSQREAVKEWFDRQNLSDGEREKCVDVLYKFMDEVNM